MSTELEQDIAEAGRVELSHHQLHQAINAAAAEKFHGHNVEDNGTEKPAYATDVFDNFAMVKSDNQIASVPFRVSKKGHIKFGKGKPVTPSYVPGTPEPGPGIATDSLPDAGTPHI